MPTFSTPEPDALRVQNHAGAVSIAASARTDATVEVHPGNASHQEDVEAAEQTLVEQHGRTIVVEVPELRHSGRTPEVRVEAGVPDGTAVRVNTASATVDTTGRLGDTELTTASGDVRLEQVASANLKTASGQIVATTVDGNAQVKTASGDQHLRYVGGSLSVQVASGDLQIGDVRGDLSVQSASGDSSVRTAGGSVQVNSASGDLRIDALTQGRATVKTASGDVTVGVAEGTAAWLELNSLSGDVRSELDGTDDPGNDRTAEIRVHTLSGDIRLTRAR